MQHAFRPYHGRWIKKVHTLAAAVAAVEAGDMIQVTASGITTALGTNSATALIGIAAEDSAYSAATREIMVLEPTERLCTFIGRVTDGAIAVGDTDSGRTCDLEDHEGVDTDTDSEHSLIIVKGRIATADGATTEGEGEFRIAQGLENLNAF